MKRKTIMYEYSPEDFIKGTEASLPRNPLIAETLFRSKDVEKWGSGLRRISQECKAAKVRVAFGKIKSGFTVTFYRPEATVQEITGKDGKKTTQKTTQKIITFLRANPEATRKNIAMETGITEDGVKYHLDKLQKKGLIKRIGPDKGRH